MTEDIVHAFMECDLNKPFYEFLKQVVKLTFNIHFEIDTPYLIKTNTDKELDIVMTIALFSIYKTIINRNKYGCDTRKFKLRYIFESEVDLIVVNEKSKRGKPRILESLLIIP